jgi:hypothetical protein
MENAIVRETKRVHVLISLGILEALLVWFAAHAIFENFNVTMKVFDELNCKFWSSSELVVIAAPGIEQKRQFYIWMQQRRWPRSISCVLPVSRKIVAKMFPFDFDEQEEFEFKQEIRTKVNPRILSQYAIQVQIADARKAFEISFKASTKVHLKDHDTLSWTHYDFSSSEVPHVHLFHMRNQWTEIHREPRSSLKEFPEESCPVVLITRFELSVERYPRGINSARLTYIPEPELINGNQALNILQFIVLPRQGDTKFKLRTTSNLGQIAQELCQ